MKKRRVFYRKTDILSYLKYIYQTEKKDFNNIIELDPETEELIIRLKVKNIDRFRKYLKKTGRNRKNKEEFLKLKID